MEKSRFLNLLVLIVIFTPEIISILTDLMSIEISSTLLSNFIATLILLLIFSLGSFRMSKPGFAELFIIVSVPVVMVFGIIFTEFSDYSEKKLYWVLAFIVGPMVLLSLARSVIRWGADYTLEKDFLIHSLGLFLVYFFAIVFLGTADVDGRLSVPGLANPIYLSRAIGAILVIIGACGWKIFGPWVTMPLLLIGLVLLFYVGARSPIIALGIALIYYHVRKFSVLLFSVVVLALLILVIPFASSSYIFETNFFSIFHRLDIYKAWYSNMIVSPWFDILFGSGIGTSGARLYEIDSEFYPHNLLLEITLEFGVVGLVLLCFWIYSFLKKCASKLIVSLFLFFFVFSMSSGDIPTNAPLFLVLFTGVLLGMNGTNRRYASTIR